MKIVDLTFFWGTILLLDPLSILLVNEPTSVDWKQSASPINRPELLSLLPGSMNELLDERIRISRANP